MNKIWLPVLLSILWILAFLFWLCPKCFFGAGAVSQAEDKKETTIKETVTKAATLTALTPTGLSIRDGVNNFSTRASNNIDFNRSSYNYITPLSEDVNGSLKEAAEYLKAHPDRGITIHGVYGKDEENNSAFENLGLARANNVKQILSNLGVSGKQLLIASSLLGSNYTFKDIFYNGVTFDFKKIANDAADRIAAIKAKFLGKPITLYFPTGKDEINLSVQQRRDFADLVYYLDNVSSSSLEVSGHTDNKGTDKLNKRLSRKRAEFVRDYLVGNGLSRRRLSARGYGPDRPIAPNDTSEGRSQNRRVEVTLE